MGKVPVDLRKNIAANIRHCRYSRYPKWGGAKRCAEAFGVSPQQWSQWERGSHMPDEYRMMEIADFFSVSTAYLRRDNSVESGNAETESCLPFLTAAAVRIENGIEVPLRVEVERAVYKSNYVVRMERIL